METLKLTFEKYKPEDLQDFKTLVSDAELMKYVTGKGLTALEATTKFNAILNTNNKETQLGYFKVFNSKNECIGDCKLERNQQDHTALEIGYLLKKDYWGMGIGTAICTKILEIANTFYPEFDIIGIIDPDNIPSKKLLEKFGFKSYFVGIEDNLPTEKLLLKSTHTNSSQ